MTGRSSGLVRALRLAKRLRGVRQLPELDVLAGEFGVHKRTVRRDIYALEESGWIRPTLKFYQSERRVSA